MANKKSVVKIPTCPDCGVSGKKLNLLMHNKFCPAKTCNECGTAFGFSLPVYDSRNVDEDGNPERLCDTCLYERLDCEEEAEGV